MSGWELLATFEGGTVAGMARAQAADSSWHVFAATPVGVFRSTDRGHTWAPLGGNRVAGAAVVAASPRYAEDGLVYAGAHDGLYRLDGVNAVWQPMLTDCIVQCIALDFGDQDARPDGSGLTVFVGTQDDGILVSRDGGRTWDGANAGLFDLCAFDLALSPGFSQDGIAFAAMSDGLFRTRNGGEAWRQLDTDTDDMPFTAVALSPSFPDDRLMLASCAERGLLRSEDAGRTWETSDMIDASSDDDDGPEDGMFGDISRLTFLPNEYAVVWAETGVAVSDIAGEGWRLTWDKQEAVGVQDVTGGVQLPAATDQPETLLAATARNGIFRSEDGGDSWTPSVSGLSASLVASLVCSPAPGLAHTLYAARLDAGLLLSRDGGESWANVSREAGFQGVRQVVVGALADGDGQVIVATDAGVFLARDGGGTSELAWPNTGDDTDIDFDGDDADYDDDAADDDDDVFSARLVATTVGDDGARIILAADERELRLSVDLGASWQALQVPRRQAAIVAAALSPGAGGAYLLVTRGRAQDLTLWLSLNGGQHWQPWLEERDVPSGVVAVCVPLPANAFGDTVLLALGRRVLRPRPNAWEVKEGVRRPVWVSVELPGNIADLAASPAYAQDQTLFAATSAGVYVSRDGGASFSAWDDDQEPGPCVSVAISPSFATDRLVYALGLGGTVWRCEDR